MKKIYLSLLLSLSYVLSLEAQTLYGTTLFGGSEGGGNIFKFNTDSNALSICEGLDLPGSRPVASFTPGINGKLYGTTSSGGANNYGILFSYDPATAIFTRMMDFDKTTQRPIGTLVQAKDGKLYGITSQSGNYNYLGIIFSFDPNTSAFTRLHEFTSPDGGFNKRIILTSSGNLFGITESGGSNTVGVLFTYNLSTSNYTIVHTFNRSDGGYPQAIMQANDGKIYGTTFSGGLSEDGVLFAYDTLSGFAVVRNFEKASGAYAYGKLLQGNDNKLYGMTGYGGSTDNGVIYSYDPSSGSYAKLYDLDGLNGSSPTGGFFQAPGGTLYGMTQSGGNGGGVIFSFDPAHSTFEKLKSFANTRTLYPEGSGPLGELVQASDGRLYAMTGTGGNADLGVIFSYDPAARRFSKALDFGENKNGSNISGDLTEAKNGRLYGVTSQGGSRGRGVIFCYDRFASKYKKLVDFNYEDGANPSAGMTQHSNGKLYGVTDAGGSHDAGVLYSFDTYASTYKKLIDFDTLNGSIPASTLLEAKDGKLYGCTSMGGAKGYGVIFSYDPISSTFTKLKDFQNSDGAFPSAKLMQAKDGKLYGTTFEGGKGYGVLFSYDPVTMAYNLLLNFDLSKGTNPIGGLVENTDGKLYGTTYQGGGGKGVIYSYDPSKPSYKNRFNFIAYDGQAPVGQLISINGKDFYGLTRYGGVNAVGVVYSYNILTSNFDKLHDFDFITGAQPSIATSFIAVTECTGRTKYFKDNDAEGYGNPDDSIFICSPIKGYVSNNLDCNDNDSLVHPGAKDICNGIDDNCDGQVDEGCSLPRVTLTAPANYATYLAYGNVYLTASASTASGSISKVEFYNNDKLLFAAIDTPYTFKWQHVPKGNYYLTAKAFNAKGDIAVSDTVHIFLVANKAPSVSIITPANEQTFLSPSNIYLEAAASDADGRIGRVEFYNGSNLLAVERKLPYSYTWTNVRTGRYQITAKSYDNWGEVTISEILNINVVKNQPPSVSLIAPANRQILTEGDSVTFEASASDPDGRVTTVDFYRDSTMLNKERKAPYTFLWKSAVPGTYNFTAVASDNYAATTVSAPLIVIVIPKGGAGLSMLTTDVKTGQKPGEPDLQLFPNPTRGDLYINVKGVSHHSSCISIISATGEVIKLINSNSLSPTLKLNMSSISKGIYIVKFIQQGEIIYKRFVKG